MSAPEERTVDGILFASKLEAECYKVLKQTIGLSRFKTQVEFLLQDAFLLDGKKVRPIKYIADFVVGPHVLDTKGHLTTEFKIKSKMFRHRYGKPIITISSPGELRAWLAAQGS